MFSPMCCYLSPSQLLDGDNILFFINKLGLETKKMLLFFKGISVPLFCYSFIVGTIVSHLKNYIENLMSATNFLWFFFLLHFFERYSNCYVIDSNV